MRRAVITAGVLCLLAFSADSLETVWGTPTSAGIVEQTNAGLPDGPNFVINSDYANLLNPDQYRSSVILGPGNSSQPNYIRNPDGLPVTPHPDLGVVTHTTTGDTDDTGTEICADVTINTFGYGACVGVDADQDYTGDPADIEESCSTDLNSGGNQTVNVYCGAGSVGTEPSYSSIMAGYDNHINHQAGTVAAQHAFIGPGDGGGHASIIGGATHYVEGDCEYSTILGGNLNAMDCLRTGTTTSKGNTIVGGSDNRIDNDGTTYSFDNSYNVISASESSVINGVSFGGAIVAAIRGGIMIDDSLDGSAAASDEARNNYVTGTGTAVISFDPGNGTHRPPSYASASGLGARSWMDNMSCHGIGFASDTAEGSMNGTDGSGGATPQACRLHLANFNVTVGNPGTFTTLFTDRSGAVPIIFLEDGVWSVRGDVVCAERNTTNPNRHFTYQTVQGVVATSGAGTGSGTASFYDNAGSAQSTIAATVVGGRETTAAWAVNVQLASRNATASVNTGFDVQVQVNNGGAASPAAMECAATVDIVMIRDL